MACFLPINFHCLVPRKTLLLAFALSLWGGSQLMAQCDRIGRIISVTPGCGAVVKDLGTGQFFRVVSGTEALLGGETLRLGVTPSLEPSPCAVDGLPTMSLTCLGDLVVAEAHFDYFAQPGNPLQYIFQAKSYQPGQTYQWSFGEGPLTDFPDSTAQHTFSQPGLYTVCLKIVDDDGKVTHGCQEIFVSNQAATLCGYDVFVTAVGTQLYAKLLPQNSSAGPLATVSWHNGTDGTLFGEAASLNAPLPGFGAYSICAIYAVKDSANNTTCQDSICQTIRLPEPGCAQPPLVSPAPLCPLETVQVCGCDNITYENECDALTAGLGTWWAGDCSSMYGACVADMEMSIIAGDPEVGYTVQFNNLSTGLFNLSHLDFGDGSPIWEATQWTTVVHHYAKGAVYRVDLSTWKQNDCASTVTKLLVTDAYNLTAANWTTKPDYVLPGDANGDKKANVYDLLNIGVGYLAAGAPRPHATTNWLPQSAANWPDQLPSALNYKHLDCDGDGIVMELDADVIEPHYSPIDSNTVSVLPGLPAVWVEFDQDTIEIDANNPTALEITASVMVGSPNAPALGLHGLSFALKYPEYVEHDPEVEYKNDFFGISNHILWLPKDNFERRQLDLGFTKKYAAASGYGRIATVTFRSDFIIIIDIIEREIGDTKAFSVPVRGLKAVDSDGNVLNLGTSALQDTVWIKMLPPTSGTHDQALQQQVRLYPNPATGETRIFTGDLEVEQLKVVNSLGQMVYAAVPGSGQVQRLSVAGWTAGLYIVRLQTMQGIVEKKLMVR